MSANQHYKGLTQAQVEENRRRFGSNVLTPPKASSLWSEFIKKFDDPLIKILLVAAVLSIGIACYECWWDNDGMGVFFEPMGIIAAILLATGLSFYFELDANREFNLLNQVNDSEPVQVIRDGKIIEIPRSDVVVDDIVILNTGDEIPADGTLLEAVSMTVDESSLTGEPMTTKTAEKNAGDSEDTFPPNMVLRGTKLLSGHGVMHVNAVGDSTENGKVFTASQIDNSIKTPLDEQLERLGHTISVISYAIGIIVIIGRMMSYFLSMPFEWMSFITYSLHTIMIAVTLLVVSIPEGLPMAVTLSLAFSMRRMLKTNNLVRKMHACETMGATTVICTDKTGTLTQNKMQVAKTEFEADIPENIIHDGIAINSTAILDFSNPASPKVLGNPTEGALLLWLHYKGADYLSIRDSYQVVKELPFSTERKFMATEVEDSDGCRILFVKGAQEVIMSMCRKGKKDIDFKKFEESALEYQKAGMRTLGFAFAKLRPEDNPIEEDKLVCDNLSFIGIIAIADPVRADVAASVSEVINAGIKVKIVTGDNAATAKEIGRQAGLWNPATDTDENLITGPEVAAMTDAELENAVESIKIIARARPMDKKRLVEALQRRGDVVAVTGDGTNDAPALKAAHVGLSMGDGTSVAKEASDITIIDNSFSSISKSVMWGRSLYGNIRRFILFQMTVNVAACLVVAFGAFAGIQSPLTVTQMLWVNLIMDTFAAMALASLPPSKSVMADKPRGRSEFIINGSMWRFITIVGLIFACLLVTLFLYFEHADITSLSELGHTPIVGYHGLTPYELSLFFTIFVFMQFWNMFNARAFATHRSAFHFKGCQGFLMIMLMIIVGQIIIVTFGGRFFNVEPLKLTDWVIIIIGTMPIMIIGEVGRLFTKKKTVQENV